MGIISYLLSMAFPNISKHLTDDIEAACTILHIFTLSVRYAVNNKTNPERTSMKQIYLMRHGETLFNKMDINQGQCDSPLTEAGIAQAIAARNWFESHGIQFQAVYCSPLLRACDTAEIITELPLRRDKGLKEIFLGFREASSNAENPSFPYGNFFVPYGGEDLNAFYYRITSTITRIANVKEEGPVLIVSHGTAMRCFLQTIDPVHRDPGVPGNCAIADLQYENGRFHLQQIIEPAR